jgi:hypothetical protein
MVCTGDYYFEFEIERKRKSRFDAPSLPGFCMLSNRGLAGYCVTKNEEAGNNPSADLLEQFMGLKCLNKAFRIFCLTTQLAKHFRKS